ncbi:MAG: hypothetical protein OEZ68_05070 [Gammaproteobacteria bacterium]|nr:hypothetical protein [Gammaproteobacteria bacterium]MDH5800160.1 hypothetical protein [Gammaproteobacteria bacterium]
MKHRYTLISFAVILIVWAGGTAAAGDTPDGEKLYQEHCMGCHDTRIHNRPNRIVHVYSDLANRVKFCDAQVQSGFNAAQLAAVTDYLNKQFYKFIKD